MIELTGRFLLVRDLQVAEDVGNMAKLGWFDKEFNFFGLSYVKNNMQNYLIFQK